MTEIMLLNGPNLNLLGAREPEIYGYETLDDINGMVSGIVEEAGYQFSSSQSNAEHELIDLVHAGKGKAGFIIINPGAFTHTSIALRDAKCVDPLHRSSPVECIQSGRFQEALISFRHRGGLYHGTGFEWLSVCG